MTDRSVIHSTFTLERTYPAAVARVFAAWSDPATKKRWFSPDGEHSLDFQVGRQEIAGGEHNGAQLTFTTTYAEIQPNERIVYNSTMVSDGEVVTVSLTSVEFLAAGEDTRLVLTEHGAYLDGFEKPEWREEGTDSQLDALRNELAATQT
jgi:uncharacterized protein YndB with AHSA1/START domain